MKDPDTLHDAVNEAVDEAVNAIPGLSVGERDVLSQQRAEEVRDLCSTWFKYSEYLEVEIDTEAKTCVVIKARN
jgi:hypothetical protein